VSDGWPERTRSVEALRRAWAEADAEAVGTAAPAAESPDAERIWRAVAGELPESQLRELVAAAARDPQVAQAWRLARELHAASVAGDATASDSDASDAAAAAPAGRILGFPAPAAAAARRFALAAMLLLAAGVGIWLRSTPETPAPMRGGEPGLAIDSRLSEGAALPRDRFVLRWTALPPAGGEGARYTLRVTTRDLVPIVEARDLGAAEHRVAPASLAALPAGSVLLWQVEGRLSDGTVVSSPTHTVRLVD
jgi:hypothetical protein